MADSLIPQTHKVVLGELMVSIGDTVTINIDSVLQECKTTDAHATTTGMIHCYDSTNTLADSLIQVVYTRLYNRLDSGDRMRLQNSQIAWTKYYKKESDFVYHTFYSWSNFSKYGHGRESAIDQAAWRYDLARHRLLSLIRYENNIFVDSSIVVEK